MALSHPFPMENSNNRRRHKRLRDFLTILSMGGLVAGCDASAKNETTKAPTPPEVTKIIADECVAITVQADMIECFQKLKIQQENEIAALDAQEKSLDLENAEKRKTLEAERTTAEELNTEIEVLSKEAEAAMKRLEERALEPER